MIRQIVLFAAATCSIFISSLSAEETVSVPAAPTGPASGYITVVYNFSTTGDSISSEGHPVQYRFNWGNGRYTAWGTSLTASTVGGATPTYTVGGTYNITVEARCQTHPTITAVSAPLLFLVQECQFYNLTKKCLSMTDNMVNTTDVSKIIAYINTYEVSTEVWAVILPNPYYNPCYNLSTASPVINSMDVSVLIMYINANKISSSVWAANCAVKP